MNYSLVKLPEPPAGWDSLIEDCRGKTVFHELAWHRHVLSIHPGGRFEYFEILQDQSCIGYFCGLGLWKGPFRVMGSPLPGTGTNYMGPVFKGDADDAEALRAILRHYRRRFTAHVEMASDTVTAESFLAAGFSRHPGVTHFCPLPETEEEGFAALRSTCRNRIRKAEHNELVAEVTDDPSIVEHFYAQYREVYGNQGLALPFGIDRPRSLFKELLPAGRLLPVWVKHGDKVIASGLFPFDRSCIYFWGAVSWAEHRHLSPNELLHWKVMQEAIRRGIPGYNMCGGRSQFKDKFGGSDIPYNHFSKSFLPLLGHARRLYKKAHHKLLRVKARWAPGRPPAADAG